MPLVACTSCRTNLAGGDSCPGCGIRVRNVSHLFRPITKQVQSAGLGGELFKLFGCLGILLAGAVVLILLYNVITSSQPATSTAATTTSANKFDALTPSLNLAEAKRLSGPSATAQDLNEAIMHVAAIPTDAPEHKEVAALVKLIQSRSDKLNKKQRKKK